MKCQVHLKRRKTYVQFTDGSISKLQIFSKESILKCNIDPKSHPLWKSFTNKAIDRNYKKTFVKKFYFLP